MFSISFVVCIISTILIVQTGHCEEKPPISSPAVAVTPVPHIIGDAIKIETVSEVKPIKNDSVAKGSPVDVKELTHSRSIKNTSNDYAPPVVQSPSNETVQTTNGADGKETVQNPKATKQENVTKDKKIESTKLPSLNASNINSSSQNESVTNTTAKTVVKPSSTSTTTTTTTTTTTPAPKKPTVTFSVEDVPDLLNSARKSSIPELKGDDNEPRILQSSESVSDRGHDFLVPVIAMIFIIPFMVIIANCTARRVRDFWSKRKYHRMDYLIEDMYN